MTGRRRALLLLLPALAACYAYLPADGWAAPHPTRRTSRRAPAPRQQPREAPPAPEPPDPDPSRSGDDVAEREPEVEPATDGRDPTDAPPLGDATEERVRIVETARRYLGHRWSGDCSNFVRSVMREAGIDLGPLPSARTMSESLHLASRDVKAPRPGDMIFFHDTFDRNRDGRLGDRWTHVALVEAVEGNRVWILHRGGKGIIRLRMNRAHPHDDAENDPIRMKRRDDPPGTRYLTGELFAAYGDVVE